MKLTFVSSIGKSSENTVWLRLASSIQRLTSALVRSPKTIRRKLITAREPSSASQISSCDLYEQEKPRAVLVGWDTLEAPTYRSKLFPAYQSGREFDEELLDPSERQDLESCVNCC